MASVVYSFHALFLKRGKMQVQSYYKKLITNCHIDKLSTRNIEMIEIVNKLEFYKNRTQKTSLKILLKIASYLVYIIVKAEADII